MHLYILIITLNLLICRYIDARSFVLFFGNANSDEYVCLDTINGSHALSTPLLQLSVIDLVPAKTDVTYLERLHSNITSIQGPVAVIASADQLPLLAMYSVPSIVILAVSEETFSYPVMPKYIFKFHVHDRAKLINFQQQQPAGSRFTLLEDDSAFGRICGLLLVELCAFLSILLALATLLASSKKMHEKIVKLQPENTMSKGCMLLSVLFLLIFLSSMLVLFYYFYDILVYVFITTISIASVIALHSIWSFWLRRVKDFTFPVTFKWRDSSRNYQISLVSVLVFPFALAFVSVWLYYRNDPTIGWRLHTVIGIFLIAYIMPNFIPLSSLLLFIVLYTGIVFYDVFMVFITPYILPDQSPHSDDTPLNRRARSTVESIMSSVATGSAGTSGELAPIAFRVNYTIPWLYCDSTPVVSLLGFGDVVIPGCLILFVALYDKLWKIPYRRTLVASILGYLCGSILTSIVLISSEKGQPALLYLCPCTLLPVLIVTLTFGGLPEFRRILRGIFPPLSEDAVDSSGKPERFYNEPVIDDKLQFPSDPNNVDNGSVQI